MPPKPSNNKRPSLEDKVEMSFETKKNRSKDEEKRSNEEKRKIISKAEVLEKLASQLDKKGSEPFNQLFSRSNTVNTQQFITFLEENYEFTPEEAAKLGEEMNTFGRVKMETLKKYIKKQEKARSPEQANQRHRQNESP